MIQSCVPVQLQVPVPGTSTGILDCAGTRYWNQCTTTIRALLVYIIFTLYRVEYMALRYQIEIRIVTLSRIEYDTAMPWNNYAIIRQRP